MIEAGMNAARLNFSHGSYSHHSMLISNIRKAAKKQDTPVAIIQDLQGPRVRIGDVTKDGIAVSEEEIIVLADERKAKKIKAKGKRIIPVSYPALVKSIKKGHKIYIDDKAVELIAEKIKTNFIECRVKRGGVIKTHKGINLPDSKVLLPTITEKDKRDIEFGIKNKVDFIALSFVRSASDIIRLKKLIKKIAGVKESGNFKIIAKIERPEALENFDKILKEVDAVMIARGDLALETPAENVPIIQKEIIEKCLEAAKPAIVATQMMESMILNPNPTRAEVSDVANAVIDHADAVMLSGESANGKYPVETVEMMAKIIRRTEESAYDDLVILQKTSEIYSSDSAVSAVAGILAEGIKAKVILSISLSGETARMISRYRPEVPIIAASEKKETSRHLLLSWGIFPIKISAGKIENIIKSILKEIKDGGIIEKGDKILILAGKQYSSFKNSGMARIIEVK